MQTIATVEEAARQAVVFVLAEEHYGVDVGDVLEIIRMPVITPVPAAQDFVKGMINLRGKIIPVVDLRERFGMEATPPTRDSRVVVVEVNDEDIGVIVDAVTEVLRIPHESIEQASFTLSSEQAAVVEGVANLDGKLIIMLDLSVVLARSAE
jgi:purine-binding chemotaxis protein CheW